MYVSVTATENLGDFDYVTKDETRVAGPWSSDDEPKFMPYQYDVKLRNWQQTVLQMSTFRDSRHVNVIYDSAGGIGKSTLAGYARIKLGYIFIHAHDTADRMIASVCDMLSKKKNRDPKCFFFDIPRSYPKAQMRKLFYAIEIIKSGIVSDSRYNYTEWIYNSPVIWVFCNFLPKAKYLSRDRWKMWYINNEELEQYVPEHVTQDVPTVPHT